MSDLRDLPAELKNALTRAAQVPSLLITSDFDGTLAPIVNNPADARPLRDAAEALVALSECPGTAAALISGRALDVLRIMSGMPATVHLVGSHGAEFDSGFAHPIDRALLEEIATELSAIAAARPGVTVELKPASVALHVRNAEPADAEAALAQAQESARDWEAQLTEGKAVLEFAVITTDKGEAIDILRDEHQASAVIYFGDDVTDEKAFRRLRDGDVGVKVGPGQTLAGYRVDEPEDVAAALKYLLEARGAN
ncbi:MULTISPECIES: trehalose-phosphatase [unclassified Mycolicibacterium]|uniref:trehalose-phosphatase n=1 Tax=unclassified Mycolicibacterium TaxID=2636767 RepID=UPI001305CBA3|nr:MULTISPECIES: trehalose-phosphatase [unclassified Mycolicibacterium]MUL84067.1 trehalose-phosphatase [Mycolicibacterium sp. CBMA 329]MUL89867.1 trehalose-phosphatase [Mycolicibacterium sp. CBMA 331]MUM00044.1 trehalose-phosphatase [Mycolicibacterium sp. CBMA 334]MUM28952.1 trehalose-phosphatase [Mycolicibacterium sp. CBMA 295]MUM39382.1 trehalose-phosphatase [Mycolicibacterium sp. CBMA 247]